MKLIAKKPCSFGGQQFFIGDEIPERLVVDAKAQEKLGIISIASGGRVSVEQADTLFTQDQVDSLIADAVEKIEQRHADEMAKLEETEGEAYSGTVTIPVKGDSDEQNMNVPVTPDEIQRVFAILQMNVTEGVKAISDVTSENVLILLHAVDSRKTIKEAAQNQAANLFSADSGQNEASNGKTTIGTNVEGADT